MSAHPLADAIGRTMCSAVGIFGSPVDVARDGRRVLVVVRDELDARSVANAWVAAHGATGDRQQRRYGLHSLLAGGGRLDIVAASHVALTHTMSPSLIVTAVGEAVLREPEWSHLADARIAVVDHAEAYR